MHGRKPPSFFSTKKKPAAAGEVEGRINPEFMAFDACHQTGLNYG